MSHGCSHRYILPVAAILILPAAAVGQVTEQQAKQIQSAVPYTTSVIPKKPRRVLIWNTPFMEQSPHKGYSIPQAEYAMRLLGEKSGAFEPVVSNDVAVVRSYEHPVRRTCEQHVTLSVQQIEL